MKKYFKSIYHRLIHALSNAVFRAKSVNLIQLPKKIKNGANCRNCHYWRDVNEEMGYCSYEQVSLYVNKRQVCDYWAADGAMGIWNNTKIVLDKDYGDIPPTPKIEIDKNKNGGVSYEEEEKERAKSAGLITLPKNIKGIHCYNCEYSSSAGWCKLINVYIEKNDKCNKWDHPDTLRLR